MLGHEEDLETHTVGIPENLICSGRCTILKRWTKSVRGNWLTICPTNPVGSFRILARVGKLRLVFYEFHRPWIHVCFSANIEDCFWRLRPNASFLLLVLGFQGQLCDFSKWKVLQSAIVPPQHPAESFQIYLFNWFNSFFQLFPTVLQNVWISIFLDMNSQQANVRFPKGVHVIKWMLTDSLLFGTGERPMQTNSMHLTFSCSLMGLGSFGLTFLKQKSPK